MNIWLFAIITTAIVTLYNRWFYGYWKSKNVKTLPPNILFGNLTDVVLGKVPVYDMFKKAYRTCASNGHRYIGYYFLGKPVLLITHPDLLNQIFVKDFSTFCDREFYFNKKVDPLSAHVISMRGAEWKRTRGMLSPVFTTSKLKNLYPTLLSIGHTLKSVINEKKTLDIRDVVSKFVFDSIASCSFGLDVNTLKNQNLELKNYTQRISAGSLSQNIKLFLCLINPKVLYFLGIPFLSRDIAKFFLNLTRKTVENREQNNITRKDLMHYLIQLRNNIDIDENMEGVLNNTNKPKALTIEEITAETTFFFSAGFDTTTTTTCNCIYVLLRLRNMAVMDKLRLEVNNVIKKFNGEITYEALGEMTYLEMVISETLRMYPVAPILSRVSTDKYKLPNSEVTIEKGTTVFVPVGEIQNDPNYFKKPQKFIPERFEPGSKFKSDHKFTFLAFGDGPRGCLGERFGRLMVKTALAIILYEYTMSVNPQTTLPLDLDRHNLKMSFKKPLLVDFCKIER